MRVRKAFQSAARLDPRVDGNLRSGILISSIRHIDRVPVAAETEGLSDFASCESCTALQRAIVDIDNVVGGSISRPPAHHVRRRGNARMTFTDTARVVDGSDFSSCQRAIEHFYFVNQTDKIEAISTRYVERLS